MLLAVAWQRRADRPLLVRLASALAARRAGVGRAARLGVGRRSRLSGRARLAGRRRLFVGEHAVDGPHAAPPGPWRSTDSLVSPWSMPGAGRVRDPRGRGRSRRDGLARSPVSWDGGPGLRSLRAVPPAVPGELAHPLCAAAGGAACVAGVERTHPIRPFGTGVGRRRRRRPASSSGVPPTARYAREAHPAFRIIEDMVRESADTARGRLRALRPLPFAAGGGSASPWASSPPRRNQEWLGADRYWRGGGREPVWFLADPRCTHLELYDPRSVTEIPGVPWSGADFPPLGGARPGGGRAVPPVAAGMDGGRRVVPHTRGLEAGCMPRALGPYRGTILADVGATRRPRCILVGGYYLGDSKGSGVQRRP